MAVFILEGRSSRGSAAGFPIVRLQSSDLLMLDLPVPSRVRRVLSLGLLGIASALMLACSSPEGESEPPSRSAAETVGDSEKPAQPSVTVLPPGSRAEVGERVLVMVDGAGGQK